MARLTLSAQTPGTVHYNSKTHNYSYTFSGGDLETIKLLSTACIITNLTLNIECATNLYTNAPSLDYVLSCGTNSYTGSLDFPKRTATNCAVPISNLSLSGAAVFGANIADDAYHISYSIDARNAAAWKYWINNMTLEIEYTQRCWIDFVDTNGDILSHVSYAPNVYPSAPTEPTADTGYTFRGWKSNHSATVYVDSFPATDGTDTTYTAQYQKIDYHIGVTAVTAYGRALNVGNKISGNGTYYIGDSFTIAANTGDTGVDSNTFLFDYWTFQDANGNTLFNGDHFSNSDLVNLQVTSTTISAWWPATASSSEHQGEYWIYGIAHYHQVYDIALSVQTNATQDPSGAGSTGVMSMSVISGNDTFIYTSAQILNGAVARVTNPSIQIQTTFVSAAEYTVFGNVRTGTGNNQMYTSWSGNVYTARSVWVSSTGSYSIIPLKKYFDLTISGDTDNVLKAYQVGPNNTRTPVALTHIPRGSQIILEPDAQAMVQTTSDVAVSAFDPVDSHVAPSSGGTGIITSLLRNYTVYVTRTEATCTMTKIVNSDGESTPVTTSESIVRSNSYRYSVPAATGLTISSATLTMAGQVVKTWTDVDSINYTIATVTGDCTLTVRRVQQPENYVMIKTPTSSYGSVNVSGETSVLKTEFTGFTINSISTRPTYDVAAASYQWMVDETLVGTGTINPNVTTVITYPSATIPAASDVALVVEVQYRKNGIYRSLKPNGTWISRQPKSLWYTPVGQAPKQVIEVYAQTAAHPEPILLFGPAPEEVEPEPPVEQTKYKVLSLESQDMLNGSNTHVHAVWTEDSGVCTPISFSTDFDTDLYDVHLDSITASMNESDQRVYTIIIYDETYGRDSYSFVCQQDNDGEWVYNNQSYNCDGQLLWGYGPATITTVYEDPTT